MVVVVAFVEVMVVTKETEVGDGNLSTSTLGLTFIPVGGEHAPISTVGVEYW